MLRKRGIEAILTAILLMAAGLSGCSGQAGTQELQADEQPPAKVLAEAQAFLDWEMDYAAWNFGWTATDGEITELTYAASVDYEDGAIFDFYKFDFRYAVAEEEREEAAAYYTLDEAGYVTGKGPIAEFYISAYRRDGEIGDTRPVFVYQGEEFDPGRLVEYIYDPAYYQLTVLPDYTLKMGDKSISINQNVAGGFPFDGAERKRTRAEDLVAYAAYYTDAWSCEALSADVQVMLEGVCERVYALRTESADVHTPRGIGPGSSEAELLQAYPADLMPADDYLTWEMEAGGYDRSYGYGPQDGSQNYIEFFLTDGVVGAVKMGMGWDFYPYRTE